jgi:hypothetical protein
VLRDMPAPNAMTRTGDFFFYVEDSKGGQIKIRSCKEARLLAQVRRERKMCVYVCVFVCVCVCSPMLYC